MLPSIVKRWLCKPKQHMLQIINQIMDERIPNERPNRDFHIKFPDEFLQDHLEVQLWFAAECLVAGSLIEMQEAEALLLRPLAEEMLHSLEEVRRSLRDQCLSDASVYPDLLKEALVRFDCSFAEFELSYVSAVVPIKSPEELFQQQQIIVLFCETIERSVLELPVIVLISLQVLWKRGSLSCWPVLIALLGESHQCYLPVCM
uniref:Uncharacterized protein n=1 Tax=Callorhinchus milii TaxID=7868 RepID=A0A4W3GNG5_CALMI